MRIVLALGGNALLQRGEPLEISVQRKNIRVAAEAIATLIREGHELIITHGNGPQVGLLALQSEAYTEVSAYPFDVLGAESQSMIGYMLQQAIGNALPDRSVVTLVTQTLVDAHDPAFLAPCKFVGPFYSNEEADRLVQAHGWVMHEDHGHYRRVIASPLPLRIVELKSIQHLVDDGVLVICAGGGGIPVIEHEHQFVGVEAVIDKDRTAALLAMELHADRLIILTDVDGIYQNWREPHAHRIEKISVAALTPMRFPVGTMGPKVEAVCRFVSETRGTAAIGHLFELTGIVNGEKGTQIVTEEVHHGH